ERMRQNTHASPSWTVSSAPVTYSPRHAAHRRSSMGDHVGAQAVDELVDLHAALRLLAAPGVHPDRAVLDVVVAHHEHVRHLLELRLADARAELVGRVLEVGAEAFGAQAIGDA